MSVVHLHLMLNHVPLVGMVFVLLLLGVAAWRRNETMGKLGLVVMVGLAVITVVVFLSGEPAEEALERVVNVSEATIHPHEEAAEAALIATGIAGALALVMLVTWWRRSMPRWVIGAALATALVATGMLAWTANLGGQIRHTEIAGAGPAPSDEAEDRRR